MPVGFTFGWDQRPLDVNHSQRRVRDGYGIKIPNDFRRGRKRGRR